MKTSDTPFFSFEDRTDLIIGSLTMNRARKEFIDYLAPMGLERIGIMIPSSTQNENFSWRTFTEPFTIPLWLVIFIVALGNAIFITMANFFHGRRNGKQVLVETCSNSLEIDRIEKIAIQSAEKKRAVCFLRGSGKINTG